MERLTCCSTCGKMSQRREVEHIQSRWREVLADGKTFFFCSLKCMAQKLGEPEAPRPDGDFYIRRDILGTVKE